MTITQYDYVPWAQFFPSWKWRQGEHVIAIGRTGTGKTYLCSQLLRKRMYVAAFMTKIKDNTITQMFPRSEWRTQQRWDPKPTIYPRVLLWPKPSTKDLREIKSTQKIVFRDAFNRIFYDGNWCVFSDEGHYLSKDLGLSDELATYQHQARSSGLSVLTGAQRPAFLPVITYGSATHAFMGRQNEPNDLKRLSLLGGVDSKELAANVLRLPQHEFIYVDNTGNRPPIRTKVEV